MSVLRREAETGWIIGEAQPRDSDVFESNVSVDTPAYGRVNGPESRPWALLKLVSSVFVRADL